MILSVMPAKAGIQVLIMGTTPCVYILASQKNGTLYVGVMSNLVKRCGEHKENLVEGFAKRYDIHDLVFYGLHETMMDAI